MAAGPDGLIRMKLSRLTTRSALFLGFGLTVAVWAVTGIRLVAGLSSTERQAAAINRRYTRAQELLSGVRAQVLLASVIVRDALLAPNPASLADYRNQLTAAYGAIDDALNQYVPILDDASEHDRVDRLRREIADFERTMLDVMRTDSEHWAADARVLLRTRLVPKRQTVLQLSEQVQALNRTTFVNEQAAIAAIYATSQRRIWQALSLALAASLAIAFVATRHAGRLQDHVAEQRAREVQTRREVQQLSARLVTAQEEERRTIARELHDEVGQVLTAIKMELAAAEHTLTATGNDGDVLRAARTVTDGALRTVRDLSHLLHPAMLDDLGLPETIAWYAKGFSDRYRLPVSFEQNQVGGRMPQEVELSAYRIVQEALTNVAKHARARSARVRLSRTGDRLAILVEDDGVGFTARDLTLRPSAERGLGLIGIRERVAQLHGTLTLDTAIGRGTKLTVELPAGAPLAAI